MISEQIEYTLLDFVKKKDHFDALTDGFVQFF